MSHANAALTPRARPRLARLIVDEGWPVARAAERYDVSWPAAKRWADRYRQAGPAGMAHRSSRPHHCPRRTPTPFTRPYPAADQREDRAVPPHPRQGWAFRRLYVTETHRRKALPGWLHEYNHHRPHTAIGGHPPISRLANRRAGPTGAAAREVRRRAAYEPL